MQHSFTTFRERLNVAPPPLPPGGLHHDMTFCTWNIGNNVINSWSSKTYIDKLLSNSFFNNQLWFILMCYFWTQNFKLTKQPRILKYKKYHSKDYSEAVGHQIQLTRCNSNKNGTICCICFLTAVCKGLELNSVMLSELEINSNYF